VNEAHKDEREEVADMDVGYWLEFWWLFPIALSICVTV
jgi:hypothetical protein